MGLLKNEGNTLLMIIHNKEKMRGEKYFHIMMGAKMLIVSPANNIHLRDYHASVKKKRGIENYLNGKREELPK